ncbi:transposase [Shinella sp.]|uniref:transposase n=1 Tax=Shinella sp. TaxID=1870904 RepID=UPI0040361722
MGRSRGGLTTKIHALVDADGLPVRLELSAGQAADAPMAEKLLSDIQPGSTLLADKAYDTDAIRNFAKQRKCWANIPAKATRKQIQLQQLGLSPAQPGGAFLQSHQTDAWSGNAIRQTCRQLPRRAQTCRDENLDRFS